MAKGGAWPAPRAQTRNPATPPTRAPEPYNAPFRTRIAAGLRTYGLSAISGRFLPHAASRGGDLRRQFSAVSVFRSHLPLRGSSGFAPDSLLGPAFVPDTAMTHKIWCLARVVNYVYAALRLDRKGSSLVKKVLYNPRALPIRFARTRASAWKIRLAQSILLKAPVAQPDRAPAF
jgi:hypothetical protein